MISPTLTSLLLLAATALPLTAQELEPRRWTHLPSGFHVFGAGAAYTEAEIAAQIMPVLMLL